MIELCVFILRFLFSLSFILFYSFFKKKRHVLADYRMVNFLVGRLFDWKWREGERLGFVGLLRITGF